MLLKTVYDHLEKFNTIIQSFPPNSGIKKAIGNQLAYLEEDICHTEDSFGEKDAIQDKAIRKATQKLAVQCYLGRLRNIIAYTEDFFKNKLASLGTTHSSMESTSDEPQLPNESGSALSLPQLPLSPQEASRTLRSYLGELASLRLSIQEALRYSWDPSEQRSPFPRALFFSQAFHNTHFSFKAGREEVSGEFIATVAEKLKNQTMKPTYLRVDIFCAPHQGEIKAFVANNRTFVAFCNADIEPARFAPRVPNQALLNRIMNDSDYKVIVDELTTASTTTTRPG